MNQQQIEAWLLDPEESWLKDIRSAKTDEIAMNMAMKLLRTHDFVIEDLHTVVRKIRNGS